MDSKHVVVATISAAIGGETEREASGGLRVPRPDSTDTFSKLLLLGPLELELVGGRCSVVASCSMRSLYSVLSLL